MNPFVLRSTEYLEKVEKIVSVIPRGSNPASDVTCAAVEYVYACG